MKATCLTYLLTATIALAQPIAEEPDTLFSTDRPTGPVIPPAPRLQVDLSVGSPDLAWWRESMKGRDERIEWWQDARFGCFIHWNASAVLAGEWQGEVHMGYAEHIQRMAKINQEDYLNEVIAKFNPVEYNADEWVQLIKRAGMRYVVITAKHHDGFAMWDTDVNDYDIVDAAPFGRDPIQELSDACKKHGLYFGVYYSHAFDWGEENGIGNDWEWQNPGGNRGLHGGLHWFDENPQMVPKHRTYIDEKSIPQVVELIEKYDPDLMWFDTASKFPLEETLRVLKAAREAKPDIVINSRVTFQGTVDFRDNHFGDYLSTGDRAVEFRHFDEEWETIPTTNESYGYHKHDMSHKTPSYLIQVLAKAVAKGGNILLNVGPMGDGRIDPIDVNILEGIGEWMAVNDASIINAGATTLTVQPWGQSTRDGNRLYLHVFDWPENGRIQVGGLKTDVTSAWMLADKSQAPLKHKRLDNKTVELQLTGKEPGMGHAVVVMNVEDAANVSPFRLLATHGDNLLHGFDSKHLGTGYVYGDGKARRDYIAGWNGQEQELVWDVYLREPAVLEVSIEYQRIGEPGAFQVSVGKQTLRSTTQGDEVDQWFSNYVIDELGQIHLPAGQHAIKFAAVGTPEDELLRFRALHLKAQKKSSQINASANGYPNIILIMADDMGYGGLSCYDNIHYKTPEIDRLAADGIRLTDYHSNGAVCSPTRAALMTGRYQYRMGCHFVINADPEHPDYQRGIPASEWTFAEALKEAGYATAIFGKWHLGYHAKFNPVRHGFDQFNGFVSGNIDAHSHLDRMDTEDWWQNETLKDEPGYHTDLITQRTIDFMRAHADKPFFIYVSHGAPHSPHQARGSKILRGPNKGAVPPWGDQGVTYSDTPGDPDWLMKHFMLPLDEGVGRIRNEVEKLGLADNTIIWFISDNGGTEKNGTVSPNTRGTKGRTYEGGHRVPGIVWAPGRIQPGTSDELIASMDIMPTSLALANIAKPESIHFDGIDVGDVLFESKSLPERTMIWKRAERTGLRKGNWKLVNDELYNLQTDPTESNNLASQYPERVKALTQEFETIFSEAVAESPYD